MSGSTLRKYILDTNCFIDAAHDSSDGDAFDRFGARAAPGLYLSAVVAAELRAGAGRGPRRAGTHRVRALRATRPGGHAVSRRMEALGTTLAALAVREGLVLAQVRRSFVFDVLVAHSCRELGAVMVSRNTKDLQRIRRVLTFEFVAPYPVLR